MKGKTAKNVIGALKSIISVHGVAMDVVADNMPFGSEAMKQFSIEWGFNVNTSSLHYQRSKGMAERYVRTIKQSKLPTQSLTYISRCWLIARPLLLVCPIVHQRCYSVGAYEARFPVQKRC